MKQRKMFGKRVLASVMSAVVLTAAAATQLSWQPNMTATAANDDYARLLQHSLYFYDANMCGTQVSENTGMDWRSDCHTGDDADGGFHDAGDHVMFGLPQGYAASTLGWGFYEFKDAYDELGQTAHYKVINDYFCTFFKNSTVLDSSGAVTNFCYQKGTGGTDHSYWGTPEDQTNDRDQYWTSSGASDIAAEYAAALALSYINFGNEEDLKYAEALYDFSTKYNQKATGDCDGFYASSGCDDDQAWAAGWLYLATNDSSYKTDCANKQKQYLGWVHCWNEVYLGAACVYAHITNDWSKVNSFLSSECNSSSYWFLQQWGSARYNTTLQLCALVATKNSSSDYTSWCQGQMDYILGNNPANTCFVVGFADNSSKYPHHRAASGIVGWDQYNNSSTFDSDSKLLVGALVGGPTDAGGTYTDSFKDAVANEVAVDYNAGFVGAAAGLYSVYKTGTLDTSIEGVTKIYNASTVTPTEPDTTEPEETEPTTEPEETEPTTEAPTTEEGADVTDKGSNIWEIDVTGAEKVIITANMAANTSAGGCVGYSSPTSDWNQVDWTATTDSSGNTVYEFEIPDGVTVVQYQVWWPSTVNSVSAVLVKHADETEPTTEPPTDEPTTEPVQGDVKYGDANEDGEVSVADVIMVNKAYMKTATLEAQGVTNADVDLDGDVDLTDSLNILKSLINLVTLPIQ